MVICMQSRKCVPVLSGVAASGRMACSAARSFADVLLARKHAAAVVAAVSDGLLSVGTAFVVASESVSNQYNHC